MVTRRRFVGTACGAALGCELAALGCSGPTITDIGEDGSASPIPTVTPNGSLVQFALADFPSLATVDGHAFAYITSLELTVLVARISETVFVGIDSKCTHGDCGVQFEPPTDSFYCGCHGARFASSGSIVSGPATVPLTSFPTTFDGSVVSVDIAGA